MTAEIDPLSTQHSQGLDARFRAHAFNLLRREGRVKVREAVATSPSDQDAANATLDTLVSSGMAEVEGGDLVGIDRLSTRPTQHRMEFRGRQLFTWCAADAVGIPAALEEDVEVTTVCPHCRSDIIVSMRRGVPEGDEETRVVVAHLWVLARDEPVCPEVNLFCSPDHLEQWRASRDAVEGQVLTVDETADLGRQWWAYLIDEEESARS